MSGEDKYSVEDLIRSSIEQKPSEFEAAFNDIIVDKLNAAVEARKDEIAASMFNRSVEQEVEDEEPESEDYEREEEAEDGEEAA